MSRPRPRSPVRPYRSSALKRRSSGRFEDHRYGDSHPLDIMDFDLRRDSGERSDAWPHRARWYREDRPRAGSADEHRVWRSRGRSRSPPRRSPPPGSSVRRRGSPLTVTERAHEAHRRSSPGRWPQSPEQRSGSSSRRGAPFRDDYQRYPEETGFSRKRVPSPDTRYDARSGPRVSPPGWDRGGHNNNHQDQQEWVSDRGARDHKDTTFYHLGRKERYVGGAHLADFQHIRERSGRPHREHCSPGRGHVIVEYDHGILDHGQPSQDYGYYCSGDQRHGGEGRSGEEHPERVQSGRKETRAGPLHGRRSPGRDSVQRQQEVQQTKPLSQDFLNCLAMDANGDVDLRHVGPSLATKKEVETTSQNQVKAGGSWSSKGKRTPATALGRDHPQETLTIKVDMGRTAVQHSQSQSSMDRQLSLDLISVGRQRLDFLPALEQSGTHGDTTVHSGTFAQEIITLVHQVKERCFKATDITLNERFSTVQSGQSNEEEEVVEEEKVGPAISPRINRRIDMSLSELRAFRKVGHKQRRVADDPSDLRHDLERRRQERLEEVKVTIPGMGVHPVPASVRSETTEFSGKADRRSGSWSAGAQRAEKPGKSNLMQKRTGPHWHQKENGNDVAGW